MATEPDQRSFRSDVFDFTGLFSDDIDGILAKLDTQQRCEVIDELADNLDMSTLMSIRDKVFCFAKKKLVSSVVEPGNVDIDPALSGRPAAGRPGDAQKIVDELVPIARKGKTRVAMDVVEFMSYLSGEYTYFPIKSTKKKVVKGRRGPKKKPARTVDPEQPCIPFVSRKETVQVTQSNASEKGADDVNVASDKGEDSDTESGEGGNESARDSSDSSFSNEEDEVVDIGDENPFSPLSVEHCSSNSDVSNRVNLGSSAEDPPPRRCDIQPRSSE